MLDPADIPNFTAAQVEIHIKRLTTWIANRKKQDYDTRDLEYSVLMLHRLYQLLVIEEVTK